MVSFAIWVNSAVESGNQCLDMMLEVVPCVESVVMVFTCWNGCNEIIRGIPAPFPQTVADNYDYVN